MLQRKTKGKRFQKGPKGPKEPKEPKESNFVNALMVGWKQNEIKSQAGKK